MLYVSLFVLRKVLRRELLEKYDNVYFNDDGLALTGETLIAFLHGATHAIIALEKIDDNLLSRLPELKVISKYGVGLDMIDIKSIKRHNVRLGWTGGVNRRSVSELVISFAISLLRHVPESYRGVLSGIWRQYIGGQLSGKTVGIIGCGFVGKDLVKMLKPFDCKILVNDILDQTEFYKKHNILKVSLRELLLQSDVVTLHVPLDDSTHNILSSDRLSLMKSSAILINIARGGLIDEEALKLMLKEGRIAAAGLDVFSIEPPMDIELLNLPNFLVTPHIGGSSEEAILSMGRAAINGLS